DELVQAFSEFAGFGQAKTPAPPNCTTWHRCSAQGGAGVFACPLRMTSMPGGWDYLILTASNAEQARAYEGQLRVRRELGHLTRVREALVVADPEGKRVGSGGSTLFCLAAVLEREPHL